MKILKIKFLILNTRYSRYFGVLKDVIAGDVVK